MPGQERGLGVVEGGMCGAARAVLAATDSGPGVGLGLAALVRAEFKAAAHLIDSKVRVRIEYLGHGGFRRRLTPIRTANTGN